jgi:protein phosphatase
VVCEGGRPLADAVRGGWRIGARVDARGVEVLARARDRDVDVGALAERVGARSRDADRFVDAYRRYCWPVRSLDDVRLAPFQILAGAGETYALRDHRWHLEQLGRVCAADDRTFGPTASVVVDVTYAASEANGIAWWEALTAAGGEGMVVKPVEPMRRGPKGVVQAGIKCRGPEYLRIIYGPDYDQPRHLERLRQRGLGRKRSLAAREFALGIEALERFVHDEPLYRVHEAVFGVLALESEPVDPRF